MKQALTACDVERITGAGAAPIERLAAHLELLERWQRRINLVGAATLADPWRRHVLDSAQLVPLLPAGARTVVDLGSGSGFPGLVVAILTGLEVHLIDSDARKCAFLREAARVTGTDAHIHNRRIEDLAGLAADVAIARACAPLATLLAYARPLLAPHGVGLFLKGRTCERELTAARQQWIMRAETVPSGTDPHAAIVRIEEFRRRDDA